MDTITARMISESIIFLLKKTGSNSAVKRAPVESVLSATATLETLMEPKKAIQCKPMIIPTPSNIKKSFLLIFKSIFLKRRTKNITIAATATRYQTSGTADTVINFPNTPVNPQRKTMSCNLDCDENFNSFKKIFFLRQISLKNTKSRHYRLLNLKFLFISSLHRMSYFHSPTMKVLSNSCLNIQEFIPENFSIGFVIG